jgi:hypothetical protein
MTPHSSIQVSGLLLPCINLSNLPLLVSGVRERVEGRGKAKLIFNHLPVMTVTFHWSEIDNMQRSMGNVKERMEISEH